MIKAVVDSTIILAHVMSQRIDSPPVHLVEAFGSEVLPVYSAETFYELERKLRSPKVERYFDADVVELFLHDVRKLCAWVEIAGQLRICRDVYGNKILETAMVSGGKVITTNRKDLLVLADRLPVPILTPAEFVRAFL